MLTGKVIYPSMANLSATDGLWPIGRFRTICTEPPRDKLGADQQGPQFSEISYYLSKATTKTNTPGFSIPNQANKPQNFCKGDHEM